jgi:hypothetical protein
MSQDVDETLSEALLYLRASLNGAILETLRDSKRPGVVSRPCPDGEVRTDRREVWDRLQAMLSGERERRLAYLFYNCGMSPAEIVLCCPQEWSDTSEVTRLRRIILERFMHRPNYEAT